MCFFIRVNLFGKSFALWISEKTKIQLTKNKSKKLLGIRDKKPTSIKLSAVESYVLS